LVNLDTEYQSKLQALMLRLSSIGKNWTPNRPRSYWIMRAYLLGKDEDVLKGYLGAALLQDTNALLQRELQPAPEVEPDKFRIFLRNEIIHTQKDAFKSVRLEYDDSSQRLIALDKQIIFALRRSRTRVEEVIRNQL
jgi:hypothetical protein